MKGCSVSDCDNAEVDRKEEGESASEGVRGMRVGRVLVNGWYFIMGVWYVWWAMILMDPNEERAQIQVSLRETNLRLDGPVVRPPLFPFFHRGDPQ